MVTCPGGRCWTRIPDDRFLCQFCLRTYGRLIADEAELGYQRTCGRCGETWPLDGEFWDIHRSRRSMVLRCRSCKADDEVRHRERHLEERRAKMRVYARRSRGRIQPAGDSSQTAGARARATLPRPAGGL